MKYKIIAILFLVFCLSFYQSYSQDNTAVTGASDNSLDTSRVDQLYQISKMSGGLLEGAIDPKEYNVGPGDEFKISIISSNSVQITASIMPDGRMLINNVGIVDLQDKNLAEAYELIDSNWLFA